MARRFETDYRMKDGETHLSEAYFNPVFRDMDLRLHAQEIVEKDWLAAVDSLNRYGLKRIDDYLAPAINRVQNVMELGFLDCSSATPLRFELGDKTVIVDEGDKRELFVPSPFIAVTRVANVTDYVLARVVSWDRATGALEFIIMEAHGDVGPWSDLTIHALPGSVLAIQGYIAQVQAIRDQAVADVTTLKNQAEAARDASAGAVIAAQNAEHSAEQAVATAQAAAVLIANGPVSSVNGKTGAVSLSAGDVGAIDPSQLATVVAGLRARMFFIGANSNG